MCTKTQDRPPALSSPPQCPYSTPCSAPVCICPSLWPWEYKVMREIQLFHMAANHHDLEPEEQPEEQAEAGFQGMEWLRENGKCAQTVVEQEQYRLSLVADSREPLAMTPWLTPDLAAW